MIAICLCTLPKTRYMRQLLAGFALTVLIPVASAAWYNQQQDIMGTRISVELWHEDPHVAERAMNAVMQAMHHVNASMSPYLVNSDIYHINQQAAKAPVLLSDELYRVIDKALYYSRLSQGAFDISFSSVGVHYDYRKRVMPSDKKIAKTLSALNYKLVVLDKQQRSIFFQHPDLKIDLGGIAKGYAVDLAIERLMQLGIGSAIVTAGGDSRILGDRKGTPWMVGIRHPRKQHETAVRIPLVNTAISTSGDYERFFIKDDQRVHHIINPATGKSASDVQSVSVLSTLAIDSDALSTTVFVLGVKKGLALVNRLPGIDAIIIDAHAKMHYSDGLLMPVPKD